MAELFLKFVNMSISASWLVLAIIVLRLVLKRTPKWINPVLWGIVGLRLILPFSIRSVLSLIPSTETINPEVINSQTAAIHSGVPTVDYVINSSIEDLTTPAVAANSLQIWINAAAAIWLIGIVATLFYAIIRYMRLTKRMETAVLLRDNIYQSEYAASPFVLGVFHPRIYLPFKITDKNMVYVIDHEKAHIKRRDHWVKPIGFLLCCLHWFNPVLWVAYSLFCRDIEFACDEQVVKQLSGEERADYSDALLLCSTPQKRLAALAFGEIAVKTRVQEVLHYQKPKAWLRAVGIMICIITAMCFLTDPVAQAVPTADHLTLSDIGALPNEPDCIVLRYGVHDFCFTSEETIQEISAQLSDILLNSEPLSGEAGIEDGRLVIFHSPEGTIAYRFSKDCSKVCLDGASEIYSVQDPERISDYLAVIAPEHADMIQAAPGNEVDSVVIYENGQEYILTGVLVN